MAREVALDELEAELAELEDAAEDAEEVEDADEEADSDALAEEHADEAEGVALCAVSVDALLNTENGAPGIRNRIAATSKAATSTIMAIMMGAFERFGFTSTGFC